MEFQTRSIIIKKSHNKVNMSIQQLSILILSVILNTAANLLVRKGASTLSFSKFEVGNFLGTLAQATINPFVILGLLSFGLSFIAWLVVISKLEASFAVPFMSISYILLAIFGKFILGENVTFLRIAGISIIIFGVYVISQS